MDEVKLPDSSRRWPVALFASFSLLLFLFRASTFSFLFSPSWSSHHARHTSSPCQETVRRLLSWSLHNSGSTCFGTGTTSGATREVETVAWTSSERLDIHSLRSRLRLCTRSSSVESLAPPSGRWRSPLVPTVKCCKQCGRGFFSRLFSISFWSQCFQVTRACLLIFTGVCCSEAPTWPKHLEPLAVCCTTPGSLVSPALSPPTFTPAPSASNPLAWSSSGSSLTTTCSNCFSFRRLPSKSESSEEESENMVTACCSLSGVSATNLCMAALWVGPIMPSSLDVSDATSSESGVCGGFLAACGGRGSSSAAGGRDVASGCSGLRIW